MSIEQQLRDAGADQTLERPLGDVLARGDRLRRRRARGLTLGAAAATACVAAGGSLVMGPGSSPLVSPAVASFSGPRTNLGADELAALNAACLGQTGDSGIPRDQAPVAAEERSGRYLAYYRHGAANGACAARAGADDRIRVTGMGSGTAARPLTGDDALALVILGYADSGDGAQVDELHAVAEVSDAVRRVTLRVGGQSFDGSIASGAVFFWVTDRHFTEDEAGRATLTAYDADGRVIGRD